MKPLTSIRLQDYILYYTYGVISVLSLLMAFYFEEKVLLALPLIIPIGIWAVLNFKKLYFFLLALIPLSIELDVTESLVTDLPTEPLMAGFLLIALFYLIRNAQKVDFSFFSNPLMLLLILHLVWLLIASIFSTVPLFSFKFILAKCWYVSTFLLVTSLVIQGIDDVKKAFWFIFISLSTTVFLALLRHALVDFDFTLINSVLRPFYRNHVNYAAILAVFLPFLVYARTWYPKYSTKYNLLIFSVLVYLVAIYFSYTRACYLAVLAMLGAFVIFRFRRAKLAIVVAFIVAVLAGKYITDQNHYLAYTPSTNTVSQHEFGDLIDATFKAEDVSSMERIYRWIAAVHMIGDRPIVGFGPNGFVENYKNYTVFVFETWISDNQERSGVHNYFLMTAVEQGLIGLGIFVSLIVSFFIWGEKIMHQQVGNHKLLAQAVLLSMVALVVNLFFSDMIEVDKTGSFFFFNMALIVLLSRNFKGLIPQANQSV